MRKMKKDKRHIYISQQANELARSGKHMDWLSVEWALRSEGFSEARSLLDNPQIREELDRICKIAQSSAETDNRKLFESWIKEYVEPKIKELNSAYPGIHFYLRENGFSLSSSFNELEIKKMFSTRKLVSTLHFEAEDGKRYKIDSYHTTPKNFDDFTDEDIISLIKIANSKRSF